MKNTNNENLNPITIRNAEAEFFLLGSNSNRKEETLKPKDGPLLTRFESTMLYSVITAENELQPQSGREHQHINIPNAKRVCIIVLFAI